MITRTHNIYHIERSLREEALMSAVEFFLPCKVPAVDMVGHDSSSWSLVLVAPVLNIDSHCGNISSWARVRTGLDEVVKQSSLASVGCSHYHHFHVVIWYATFVPGFEVTDDSLHWPIQEVRIQREVLQSLKVQLQSDVCTTLSQLTTIFMYPRHTYHWPFKASRKVPGSLVVDPAGCMCTPLADSWLAMYVCS